MKKYLMLEVKALADIFGVKMYVTVHWFDVDDHEMRQVDAVNWGDYFITLEKGNKQRFMSLRIADEKGEYYWGDDDWRSKLLAIMEDWGDEKAD